MSLTDWEITHIRAALRNNALSGCNGCKLIREKLAFDLKHRRAQRRIMRQRNRLGI